MKFVMELLYETGRAGPQSRTRRTRNKLKLSCYCQEQGNDYKYRQGWTGARNTLWLQSAHSMRGIKDMTRTERVSDSIYTWGNEGRRNRWEHSRTNQWRWYMGSRNAKTENQLETLTDPESPKQKTLSHRPRTMTEGCVWGRWVCSFQVSWKFTLSL